MTPKEIIHSIYDKGECSDEDVQTLLREATKEELITAAITLKPSDSRARLLIRRYEGK
jgi:hypothetical protein